MDLFLRKISFSHHKRPPNEQIQLRFLKQLSRLLQNGYPLIEALEVIQWEKPLKSLANAITNDLLKGISIDEAFENADFHQTIVGHLYFIRANGDLITSIEKCYLLFDQQIKYRTKFKRMIRYPTLLLLIFSLLLYFIKHSVLPSFLDLFQTSKEAATTIMISLMIINFLGYITIISIVSMIIFSIIWRLNKEQFSIEKRLNLYNRLPFYRTYLRLQTSFLFATHFSTLIKTGLPLKEILIQMSKQKKLPIIAYYANRLNDDLEQGHHIHYLLPQFAFFEKEFTTIFQKNSDMNELEKDLTTYAQLLIDRLERMIMNALTFIQPVIFTVIALFIIFVYVTLLYPMFQLIQTM